MSERYAVFSQHAFDRGMPAYVVRLTSGILVTATYVSGHQDAPEYHWSDKMKLGEVSVVESCDSNRPFSVYGI